MGCDRNCAACGGCQNTGVLELTEAELEILEELGQFAFLPIARTAADPAPIYPEQGTDTQADYSLILQVLEKKGLVSLDFDKPLKNFSAPYPILGSMALTERGQRVLEILQTQGIS